MRSLNILSSPPLLLLFFGMIVGSCRVIVVVGAFSLSPSLIRSRGTFIARATPSTTTSIQQAFRHHLTFGLRRQRHHLPLQAVTIHEGNSTNFVVQKYRSQSIPPRSNVNGNTVR